MTSDSEEIDRKHLPEPADPVARIAAKIIDALLAGMVARIAPPIGLALGLVYLLIGDGMDGGRSIGKRLLGLSVVDQTTHQPASVSQSVFRNAHLALLFGLLPIPLLGVVLAAVLGTFIAAVELYAIFNDEHGLRMGDLFGKTIVVGHAWVRADDHELESASP